MEAIMILNLAEKKKFLESLNERQRRHFAAIESNSLGWRGVTIVSAAFEMNPHTIRQGKKDLLDADPLALNRVRRAGGGRKKKSG